MNTFANSDNERLNKSVIDRRISESKVEYGEFFLDSHGYLFCERCKKNKYGCPGNASSHIISVDELQKSGRSEMAYDITIYERLGDKCHKEIESWKHRKREAWYWARLNQYSYEEFIEAYSPSRDLPEYMRSFQGIRKQAKEDL